MRGAAIAAAFVFATAVFASPPPPPPQYVTHAAEILTADWGAAERPEFAALFGKDVAAYVDGTQTITGKRAWLTFERAAVGKFERRVNAYARSNVRPAGDYGELLIVDEVNPISPYGDARWSTRSTLYQFGRDGLIHTVRITEVHGFLETAPRN